MSKLTLLPTPASATNERIVRELEDLLNMAKEGKITSFFTFYEDDKGSGEHVRIGLADDRIMYWCEVIKKRLLRHV